MKANIAAFGGDSERITIFGQSAGATDVGYAMASPLAQGLFRRAIIESSPSIRRCAAWYSASLDPRPALPPPRKLAKSSSLSLARRSIAALREMPLPREDPLTLVGRKFAAYGLRPVIDGWVLPRDASDAISAGQQNGTELLLGSTINEGTQLLPATTPEALRATIEQGFETQAGPFAALYTGTDPATATVAQDQLLSDYVAAMARVARPVCPRGRGIPRGVYSFETERRQAQTPVKVGAFHCAELAYVFGTQNTIDRPWEAIDRQLSDVMSSYWVRFAATGNPNGPNLPEWPAYEEKSKQVKEFGSRVSVGPAVKAAPLFEAYLSTRLPPMKQ